MKSNLSDICEYVKDKVDVTILDDKTYISTENMVPNKGGITSASSLPTIALTQAFLAGDVLVSNIRPYFKKIWFAEFDGGCSNDVLVFRAKEGVHNRFLYYVLADDTFFDYSMTTSKGTKMPRGDKAAIMKYEVPDFTYDEQIRISRLLELLDRKIQINTAINENLHQLMTTYYAEIFKDCDYSATISDYSERVFSGGTPTTSNDNYWNGSFKWLSSGETSQRFIVDTEKTITQEGIDNSSTRLASKYNTVIASAGQGHTRGQTSMLLTDSYVNQSIIVIDSEKVYMPFIYWNICGRYEELRVISNSNSIRGSLTTKMISSLSAPKADIELISKFSELSWSAIHEIEKNCNEISRLTALRDTLLPKLINGEIDVSAIKI